MRYTARLKSIRATYVTKYVAMMIACQEKGAQDKNEGSGSKNEGCAVQTAIRKEKGPCKAKRRSKAKGRR
jgi:hypothetical protein